MAWFFTQRLISDDVDDLRNRGSVVQVGHSPVSEEQEEGRVAHRPALRVHKCLHRERRRGVPEPRGDDRDRHAAQVHQRPDLTGQRIDLGTARQRLGPLTATALTAYLHYRRQRWPDTRNQHLLLTRRTAHERGPVSAYWLTSLFDGLPATAAQLREDRILEEARAANGDPLRIAAMFGLTAKPALRYAMTVWPERAQPT
ncbi:hypothetical protein AB0M02_09195 [Actinoplanes sp. NPDC051861]|uniref:hypothetical protein n=1 Tax=Actinoplanes sp. NPDC051861 TaxID=3155170 RepID=UPI00342B2B64